VIIGIVLGALIGLIKGLEFDFFREKEEKGKNENKERIK
jgi:hypothetical protein